MLLFANEPAAYREAMSRAVAHQTGLAVATLPSHGSIEEAIRRRGSLVLVLVTSGPTEAAARLSERVAVVHLSHEPHERVAVYRDGKCERDERIEGLDELSALLAEIAPAGG